MPIFDPERIQQLGSVSSIEYQPSMSSTSDRARQLVEEDSLPLPLLVITDQQTAGRGQPGKQWIANKESLTFTWCFEQAVALPTSSKQLLPLVVGLAICKSLDQLDVEAVSLKWPNDILVQHRKVAGILVESCTTPSRDITMIGIGVNVNHSNVNGLVENEITDSSQLSNCFAPISLAEASKRQFELPAVLDSVLENLVTQCDRLLNEPNQLVVEMNQRFRLRGQTITISQANEMTLIGNCLGIGPAGELLLESETGLQSVYSGTIVKAGI